MSVMLAEFEVAAPAQANRTRVGDAAAVVVQKVNCLEDRDLIFCNPALHCPAA
jgi:hypothetical protein